MTQRAFIVAWKRGFMAACGMRTCRDGSNNRLR